MYQLFGKLTTIFPVVVAYSVIVMVMLALYSVMNEYALKKSFAYNMSVECCSSKIRLETGPDLPNGHSDFGGLHEVTLIFCGLSLK